MTHAPDTPTLLVRTTVTRDGMLMEEGIAAIPLPAHVARETLLHALAPRPITPPFTLGVYAEDEAFWRRNLKGEQNAQVIDDVLEWSSERFTRFDYLPRGLRPRRPVATERITPSEIAFVIEESQDREYRTDAFQLNDLAYAWAVTAEEDELVEVLRVTATHGIVPVAHALLRKRLSWGEVRRGVEHVPSDVMSILLTAENESLRECAMLALSRMEEEPRSRRRRR